MYFQSVISRLMSYIIMPAQSISLHTAVENESETLIDMRSLLNITNHKLSSSSNSIIDARLYRNPDRKEQPKYIIIHAVANSAFYEIFDPLYLVETCLYNYDILGFNFRNVQRSTGIAYSEEDWIDDALTVINFCEEQGYPPEHILAEGHSLGGAILTLATERKYQHDCEKARREGKDPSQVKSVRLINNRSFSNLTEVVLNFPGAIGIINTLIYLCPFYFLSNISVPSFLSLCFGTFAVAKMAPSFSISIARPWVKGFLESTFGNMDAAKAFANLPDDAKDHLYAKHDFIADNRAGLHSTLKVKRQHKKQALLKQLNNPDTTVEEARRLKAQLLDLKDCKLHYPDKPTNGVLAHNISLYKLKTYRNKQEQSYLESGEPEQISGQIVLQNKIQKLLKPGH